jgi:hypothetical protein
VLKFQLSWLFGASESTRALETAMGKKKAAAQKTLHAASFYPVLSKPAVAVGKYSSVVGRFWKGCPAADKEKRFLCTVIEFVALHDFGDGVKSAAFLLKEMGVDGAGSLELGVASGDEFHMAYPLPFLEYYYFHNRLELPANVRDQLFPAAAGGSANGGADEDGAEDGVEPEEKKVVVKEEKEKPPIFECLERVSSTLNVAGPKGGSYTNKYKCSILLPTGKCGCSITLYATGDGKSETTSNAWQHLRTKADAGCTIHKEVLSKLNASNKHVVLLENGEEVKVFSFEEAFNHHVDYVWYALRA